MQHTSWTLLVATAICLMFSVNQLAEACLHAQGASEHSSKDTPVKQTNQTALILFNGEEEELILSADYHTSERVKSLAWVLPVPSFPTQYEAASDKLLPVLNRWARLKRKAKLLRAKGKRVAKSSRHRPSKTPLIRLAKPAHVGPYHIQPIQASGTEAMSALNEWMTSHGFKPLPEEGLQYYLERSWTFLAIKVEPSGETASLQSHGGLPPLKVRFPSKRVIFPLKFSTHMGVFSARIYLFSSVKFTQKDFAGAHERGFEVVHQGKYLGTARFSRQDLGATSQVYPATLPAPLQSIVGNFFGDQRPTFSVLFNERINTSDKPYGYGKWHTAQFKPEFWVEDLSVPGLKTGQKLYGLSGRK